MAKRPKAKAAPPGAMTRRDPEAKRKRREEREREPEPDEGTGDDGDARDSVEPKKAELKKAEPKKAELKKAEPKKAEPKKAEPKKEGPADDGDADASERSGSTPNASVDDEVLVLRGEAWGHPFARLENRLTWLETRMLAVALGALVVTLCIWFGIRGMKDPVETGSPAGTLWRALVGMSALGVLARVGTKRLGWDESKRTLATVAAVVVGALLAKSWRTVGIGYFGNLIDWLQQGSSIALFGGLKGISTRLTMLVSLIGASLACATGTHINIDVVVRFIPKSWRKGAHVAGLLGAAVVCLVSSWGFLDFIAVSGFKAPPEASAGAKIGQVAHELGDHAFALRKQLGLDLGALPYVIKGQRWNAEERMNGAQWNTFLDESGYVERFGKEKVDPLRATGDDLTQPRRPFVVLPGESAAGILIHGMDLLFPVGFLMIGLRMLLRVILVQSGQITVDEEPEPEDEPDDGSKEDADVVEEVA